jgi:hypothetical protein
MSDDESIASTSSLRRLPPPASSVLDSPVKRRPVKTPAEVQEAYVKATEDKKGPSPPPPSSQQGEIQTHLIRLAHLREEKLLKNSLEGFTPPEEGSLIHAVVVTLLKPAKNRSSLQKEVLFNKFVSGLEDDQREVARRIRADYLELAVRVKFPTANVLLSEGYLYAPLRVQAQAIQLFKSAGLIKQSHPRRQRQGNGKRGRGAQRRRRGGKGGTKSVA